MSKPSTSTDDPDPDGDADSDDNVCGICNLNTTERLVNVTIKGKESLKATSIERRDNLLTTLTSSDILFVHASCRSNYINRINVEAAKRKAQVLNTTNVSPVKRKLRRSSSCSSIKSQIINDSFNWEENCMICGNEANIEKQKKLPSNRRKNICMVESSDCIGNVLKLLNQLTDDYHRAIFKRISGAMDLITLNAKYHKECYKKLLNTYYDKMKDTKNKYSDKVDEAMEEIYNFILSSDECQFTVAQLKAAVKICDVIPHEHTIMNRLNCRFKNQIVISSRMGGATYVCFSKNLYDLLTDSRCNNEVDIIAEENRIIDAASELIRRKIRNTLCRMDEYPASDKILNEVDKDIPSLLLRFLNNVIYKDKVKTDSNEKLYSKKISSISHAIMSAARPKSFISPLLLATGATLYRKFGSKKIIDLCYQLGFSCSYDEVKQYEMSAACQAERILKEPFLQIVSDNSDFNVSTIDGRGTFHNLGSIEIITPATSLQDRMPIKRIQYAEIPKDQELVERNKVDVLLYNNEVGSGLKNIIVESVEQSSSFKTTFIEQLNTLWMFLTYIKANMFLGWNGFMSMLTKHCTYELSVINFLPFINESPSNYNTLYTALKQASDIALKEGMKTCIITFDQPLYIKARDIVGASKFDKVQMVVRLGGFHLVMSFMGCIGKIMAGSGINDILSIIYAEGSIDKILTGHSYARAVRAHTILQGALSQLLFDELKRENIEFQKLVESEDAMACITNIEDISSNITFQELNQIFDCKLGEVEERGNTSKLWILYIRMVSLLKTFISAERMGAWEIHLDCIQRMIPFFHAAGHFNYAKSARLYLQDMKCLKETMDPVEYKKFSEDGFFTARRSNAFYSGIFTDQTIEQTLMRAMSVEGGPFKRGATESTVFKWIKGVIYTKDIIESLETFCGLEFHKSHQHVDSREARIERDKKDVLALKEFLVDHNPFDVVDNLRNIVTGMIGTAEINCYNALAVGVEAMKEIDGLSFKDIKQTKKNTVVSLLGVNSKVKIGDKTIPIDPLLLFQRICIMKKSDEELESYLKYELAPYPLSLFDQAGMRKSTKSVLYSLFETVETEIHLRKELTHYIIDGGMLLYRVKWPTNCSYQQVFDEYVSYLKRNFGNHVSVVFDAYNEESTKVVERNRRSQKCTSKEYHFRSETPVIVSQEKFLSNYQNKSRFISYLIVNLERNSIKCHQEKGEADELIVEIALKDNSSLQKVIVAEDVDILIILTARAHDEQVIYFLKLGKKNTPLALYSSKSFEVKYPNSKKSILFSHSFSGCDTTSAFYNKGKIKMFDLVENRPDLRERIKVFYDCNANVDQVLEAGKYCAVILYGTAREKELKRLDHVDDLSLYLQKMRYESFIKAAAKNSAVKFSSLPPTVDALNEHSKRVYLQTQVWLGNQNIHATDWGWVDYESSLQPKKMQNKPAPQELLKMIFCNCKKGCGGACSCRKIGLFCNSACGTCYGTECQNCPPVRSHEDEFDSGSSSSEEL